MSATDDKDTQFNCRLCNFVGTSKTEIAEHFLTEHIEQYVSLSKATPTKSSKADEDIKKEDKEAEEAKPSEPKVQDGSEESGDDGDDDSRAEPKKSKTLDEIMEQKLERDAGPGLGRGMRRRKKATPIKYSMDDDEDEDEWLPRKEPEPTKTIYVKAPSIINKGRGRKRKRGRPGRPPAITIKKEKTKGPVKRKAKPPPPPPPLSKAEARRRSEEKNLPIPYFVLNRILDDQVAEWFKMYKQKRESIEMIRCPNDRCANVMSQDEMKVHEKCHVPNLDGFRCCDCGFISLHWAKMRVHYRTEHNPKMNAAACDFEGCSKTFPCIGTKILQTHAIKAHLKPRLLEKLKSPNFDTSEFGKFMIEPENDADRESMDKKRGGRKRSAESGDDDDDGEDDDEDDHPDNTDVSVVERKKSKSKRRKFQRYKVFVCSVCFARFKDEKVMSEHKENHYKGEDKEVIYCTECQEFNATEEAAMRDHLSNKHKRMLHLHRCEECNNFSTNHYHDLKKHIVTHTGAKNYMCELCGRRTTTPFNLRIHYRRIHATEDEKKHECMSCDYKCADKGILKEHIKHKHGLLLNKDSYGRPKPTPTFACPHCEYVGRKHKSLEYHMRIHTENRQYKCHLCPYASKTKNNLVLHVRTHEGLQPNKCSHCDFRGATNKIVSEHIMSKHAKVRPYRCNVCGWTAAYNGNMWKHIETHQKLLGEQMPEFPVSVLSGIDDLTMPTALRAPSGKRRGQGNPSSPSSPSKPKPKRNRPKYADQPSGVILANRSVVQEVPVLVTHTQEQMQQPQPQPLPQLQPQPQPQVQPQPQAQPPQPPPLPAHQPVISTEGMVIQMINVEPSHDGQHIVKVSSDGSQIRHYPIMEYSVPPVSVAQQIIAAGSDMAQVIADQQHYQHHQIHHHHQQPPPLQQQQQQPPQQQQPQQQQPQQHALPHPPPSHTPLSAPQLAQQPKPVHPVPLEIHTVAMHPSTQSNVPTPVVEQIVRDTDHAVHHLVAAMMPRW